MPKLDLDAIPATNKTGYPPEFAGEVQRRFYKRLGPVAGLTDFGACYTVLEPGAWSSHRHWHEGEDELVVIISGEAVLVDDHGETPMAPGDVATFLKGDGNGHVLQNRSEANCVFLAISGPGESDCHYPDIDMHYDSASGTQRRKDGSGF